MSDEELTDRQRERIQRWFDGELEASVQSEVEDLIESDPAARAYLERLREVRNAAEIAHDELLASADSLPDPGEILAAAESAPPLAEEPIEELAPLLERYHDGETLDVETRAVERVLDERDDAAAYLDALRELGESVRAAEREARAGIDFDAFREDLDRRLEQEGRSVELLHRYVDGELAADERDRVEEWIERDDRAAEAVSALEELREAARLADEEVRSRADLETLWSGIEARLDEDESETAEASGTVVSIDGERTDDEPGDASEATGTSAAGTVVELFSEYRSHLAGAAAAAVVLLAVAALVRPGFFQNERVVVKEKKTVVIVDSVEQRSGSSVVVDGPMRQVGAGTSKATSESESSDSTGASETSQEPKEEKPTVIWLLDSDQESDEGADDEPAESPAKDGADAGSDPADETDESRDAGGSETAPSRSGQPI